MNNYEVIVFSYYRYPEGDAGSHRQMAFAQMYSELSYNVLSVGMGEHFIGTRTFNGIDYISFRNVGFLSKLKNYFFYTRKAIKTINKNTNIKIIHLEYIPLFAAWKIKRIAKKRKIKIIHDVVEWYSASQFSLKYFSFNFIIKEIYNRIIIDKESQVIAISKFIKNYYDNKGIKCIRIPVVFSTYNKRVKFKRTKNNNTILYAGSPGKKDLLIDVIKAIDKINKTEDIFIELTLAGISEKKLNQSLKKHRFNPETEFINALGRISYSEVINRYSESSYSILVRPPEKKYVVAGFPTKVVESMFCGVPPITNLTSDLGIYLKNKVNSIIIVNNTEEEIKHAIMNAFYLSDEDYLKMSKETYKTAEDNFINQVYLQKLKNFVKEKKNDHD